MKMFKRMQALLLCVCMCAGLWCVPPAYAAAEPETGYLFKLRDDVLMPLSADGAVVPVAYADGYYTAESMEQIQPYLDAGMIEFLAPDEELTLLDEPGDPLLSEQWYLDFIEASALWENGLDGSGVTVAVIDSGIYEAHEDLAGATIRGYNFLGTEPDPTAYGDDKGHGTFVAGILAAQAGNAKGIAGLADGVEILALRCFSSDTGNAGYGSGKVSTVLAAIGYAIEQDADIINMSFGGTNAQTLAPLKEKLEEAAANGILLVASAGNKDSSTLYYPAAFDCVVGVGSVNRDGTVATLSAKNDSVYVTAPGTEICGLGYTEDSPYLVGGGTSYAAPMVSALAAAARQRDGAIDGEAFRELLRRSAVDAGEAGYDTSYGHGIISASRFAAALNRDCLITYQTNGGTIEDESYAESYQIGGEQAALPAQVSRSDYYDFAGWYADAGYTRGPLTSVPAGSTGDLTFYAKWVEREIDYAVSSVTVMETIQAEAGEGGQYTAVLPYGTVLADLKAEDITVAFDDARAALDEDGAVAKPESDPSGKVWTFAAGGKTYTLTLAIADAPRPAVRPGSESQSGAAVPASYDGLTAATAYECGDVAAWFDYTGTDTLTYHAAVVSGMGNAAMDGAKLTYTPTAADAGTAVVLSVTAKTGEGFLSETPVTLTIDVGEIPVSDSAPAERAVVYDVNLNQNGLAVTLRLFGNRLNAVSLNGTELTAGSDYVMAEPELQGEDGVCTLTHAWLSSLAPDDYELVLRFDDGRTDETKTANLTLTVSKTEYAVTFYNGQELYGQYSVVPNGALAFPDEPSLDGYDFDGWYTAAEDGEKAVEGTPVTAPLTLYARWTEQSGGLTPGGGGVPSGGGIPAVPALTILFSVGSESLNVRATMEDGMLAPEISDVELRFLLYAVEGDMIVIDASEAAEADGITLSSAVLALIGEAAGDPARAAGGLTIRFTDVSLTFDAAALSSLTAAGGDAALRARRAAPEDLTEAERARAGERPVYTLSLTVGGETVETLSKGSMEVCFAYACTEGEAPERLLVWHTAGGAALFPVVAVSDAETVKFSVSAFSRYGVACHPFSDVDRGAWSFEGIAFAWLNGLVEGTGDGRFEPRTPMSRAMLVTVLHRLSGETAPRETALFDDTAEGLWYSEAVCWAAENGIVTGIGQNLFAPGAPVTREQIAAILCRYAEHIGLNLGQEADLSAYADAEKVSGWAAAPMRQAVGSGLITGKTGRLLDPQGEAGRDEIALMLMRFCQII